MTDDQLRQFWTACGVAGIAGAASRFCLLTATRRNETTGANWIEMFAENVWTIPSSRYKTKTDHIVPLSRAAVAVTSQVERTTPLHIRADGTRARQLELLDRHS